MRTSFLTTLVVFLASLPLSAVAGEGGWGLPNLNPFASKAKPPTSARVSDDSWQMPSLRRSSGPSTWQKMNNGTKSFFSKTASALNPWDSPPETKPVSPSGRNSAFSRTTSTKTQPESSGSWFSWWGGAEEPQRPKTVNDFLMQERPQP